jgi:LacI family transcriptional regulator
MVARYLSENNILSIKLVGFDLIEQNIKYLNNGFIDFILFDYAEKQGETGLQVLFDYIMKKKAPAPKINMPIHIVAKENLEGFVS